MNGPALICAISNWSVKTLSYLMVRDIKVNESWSIVMFLDMCIHIMFLCMRIHTCIYSHISYRNSYCRINTRRFNYFISYLK